MQRGNILVVEDQRAVAGALRMRLRSIGFDVLAIAKDGPEAIEKAGQLKPDLILMDIRLGDGMDGIEAAHQIRSRYGIPIVYVSAYADRALLDRVRATEPAGFINKPFTTKDLMTTLNLAMDRPPSAGRSNGGVVTNQAAVITTDLDGRVTFVNRGAESLTGWTREAVVGQRLSRILTTLYGLTEEIAEKAVRQAIERGQEQVLREDAGRGPGSSSDMLSPLRDTHDIIFGLALRFGRDTVRDSLTALERFATASRFVFDQLPLAFVLVDSTQRIEYCNNQAQARLQVSSNLRDEQGYLRTVDSEQQAAFEALIRRVTTRARSPASDTAEMLAIKTVDAPGSTVVVAVPVLSNDSAPCAALLLYEEPSQSAVSAPGLRMMYGLSRSEVNLVQALANGGSIDEGARRLGIAVNTARTHLKHIFKKTGAKRQAELMHQVETGPAALSLKWGDDE